MVKQHVFCKSPNIWLQEDRKTHYEALKKENDVLIGKINAHRAAQAEQEPKIAKVMMCYLSVCMSNISRIIYRVIVIHCRN